MLRFRRDDTVHDLVGFSELQLHEQRILELQFGSIISSERLYLQPKLVQRYLWVSGLGRRSFDSLYTNPKPRRCENEWRSCLDSDEEDSGAQYVLSEWNKECDSFISFTPTTPSLLSLTSTYAGVASCEDIQSVCALVTSTGLQCASSYPQQSQSSQFLDCMCQEPVISAASVCEFDGNITCHDQPATLTNIAIWRACPVSGFAPPRPPSPV